MSTEYKRDVGTNFASGLPALMAGMSIFARDQSAKTLAIVVGIIVFAFLKAALFYKKESVLYCYACLIISVASVGKLYYLFGLDDYHRIKMIHYLFIGAVGGGMFGVLAFTDNISKNKILRSLIYSVGLSFSITPFIINMTGINERLFFPILGGILVLSFFIIHKGRQWYAKKSQLKKSSKPKKEKSQYWVCEKCRCNNFKKETACSVCGTERPVEA